MSKCLTEEEMRLALFGPCPQGNKRPAATAKREVIATPQLPTMPLPKAKVLCPKLRVTLHVSSEFEGHIEVFTYDANTLSTIVAVQEAKTLAKKQKFKYFDVVSINSI